MTVENKTSKTDKLVMGSKTYDFDFDVLLKDPTEEDANRAICCVISDGLNEYELEYGKDYSVSLNSDKKGGIVTVGDYKNSNWTIIIYRKYKEVQESDYNDFNSFPAETLEGNLDKVTMILQQHQEQLDRCVKTEITDDRLASDILNSIKASEVNSIENAELSRAWAIGDDEEVPEAGEHSSKGNAGLAFAIANADEDVPIPDFNMPSAVTIKGEKGDPGPQLEECIAAIEENGGAVLSTIDEAQTRADASVKVVKQYKDVVITTAAEVLAAKEAAAISENNARASAELAERFANAGEDEIITTE